MHALPIAVLALSVVPSVAPAIAGEASAQAPEASPRVRTDVEALVERIGEVLDQNYVFPDVARACARRLEADLAAGHLDPSAPGPALAQRLTDALQDVSHDKHLRVNPRQAGRADPKLDPIQAHSQRIEELRAQNYGFQRIERLDGNVGYLELLSFSPAAATRPTLVGAMATLASCDALVVDLRRNGGGDPETVRLLCSYLFEQPTHINSLYYRASDSLTDYWTLAEMPGERLASTPVFVLTSSFTFSAAEEFTYNLKTQGRATVVGETTGGGANPGGTFVLDEAWQIFVPTGRAVNPITGTNWEGTGVAPDVEVSAEAALERALPLAVAAAASHRDQRRAALGELRTAICSDLLGLAPLFEQDAGEAAEVARGLLDEGITLGVLDSGLLQGLALESDVPALRRCLLEAGCAHWPLDLDLWRGLADVAERAGAREDLRRALERILVVDPHDSGARARLSELERRG